MSNNTQIVTDKEHIRFRQTGELIASNVVASNLNMHTLKFTDGNFEQFLSYQIDTPRIILFLDVDGVLNSLSTTNFKDLYPIDPYMAFLVGRIQLETGCEVVLSSAWRSHPQGVEHVSKHVVKLLDKTPHLNHKYDPPIFARGRSWDFALRGEEVNAWLAEHPEVTKYAILDDSNDFYDDQPLFKTTFESGLNDEIAKQVIEYLNA